MDKRANFGAGGRSPGGDTRGGRPRRSFDDRRAERAAVEDPAVVLEAAVRFLEARSRSVAEVRRRLTAAGYRSSLVEGAIERLLDLEMLDDEAFATAWVASRDRARPRGESALRRELTLKGIARETIAAVLEARREDTEDARIVDRAADRDDEADGPRSPDEAAAARLLERHASALARVEDPRKRRQRAYALLARNGFDPEICSRLSAAAAHEEHAEP